MFLLSISRIFLVSQLSEMVLMAHRRANVSPYTAQSTAELGHWQPVTANYAICF